MYRTCLLAAACFVLSTGTAAAQNYRFHVEVMDVQLYVQPDASVRIEYSIVFTNQPGAHPIDVVDIGLPHADYQIESMSASIDGKRLTAIRPSEYIDVGVEVPLGSGAIPAGQKGTLRFQCTMPNMVYQDTTDASRAALQFLPTWFDPSLQVGTTNLVIAVHLLPTVQPGEVTYHREETRYHHLLTLGADERKHVAAVWNYPNIRLSDNNPKIGVSFPKRGMQRVVRMSAIGLLVKWFDEHPRVQFVSGVLLVALAAFTFLRFAHGTGWVLLLLIGGGLVLTMFVSPGGHLLLWPVVLVGTAVNEWYLRRRRSRYLPAMATVEGGGIKRGLTAPEAAVLLELPLGRILALVTFGLLKKGVLRVVSESPFTVAVGDDYQVTPEGRVERAAKHGVVIHAYEQPFIDRLIDGQKPLEQCDLHQPLRQLIEGVARRMKGFDLSDTQEYYRRIVARAWKEAESIGEIEQRQKVVDRHFDWMMMEPTWGERMGRWGGGHWHYRPVWTYSGPSAAPPIRPESPPPTSTTSFGEVAGSFVGWVENTTGRLASTIEPTQLGLDTPRGVVDLSGVDRVTADVLKAMAESGGSGGGGGGGGGCACAGCACACACAGGGR